MRQLWENPQRQRERDPVWDEILSQRGAMVAIANHLGLSRQAVNQWATVPPQHIPAVSRLTGVSQRKIVHSATKFLLSRGKL